jgi:hypothetical protein
MRDFNYWYCYMRLSGYDHWSGLFLAIEMRRADRKGYLV